MASEVGVEVAGQEDDLAGPSAASLSKARYKLDLMLMVNRREFWKKHPYRDHFIALGCFAASLCRVEWVLDMDRLETGERELKLEIRASLS